MLFDPESNLDLLVALLGLVLALVAIVAPALEPLIAQGRPGLALLLVAVVGLPPLLNLARYRRAPGGCAVLPLGFLLCGAVYLLGGSPLEWALALAAPNVLFLVGDAALRPLVRRERERRTLGALEAAERGGAAPEDLASYLTDASPAVRERAADLLGARPVEQALPAIERVAREGPPPAREAAHRAVRGLAAGPGRERALTLLRDLVGAGDVAVAAPAARALPSVAPAAAAEALSDPRPEVRLALDEGLLAIEGGAERRAAAEAAVALAADAAVAAPLRAQALEQVVEVEGALAPAMLAAARAGLERDPVTAEALWLLAERGEAGDAPRAARWVGDPDFERANAAVEATAGIVARTERLGEAAAATRGALEAGRDGLRQVHPEGDNMLADRLVARIEDLLAVIAEEEAAPGA